MLKTADMDDGEQVRRQLDKILSSRGFAESERLQSLLRYLVERKLQGEEHQIKEVVLAMEVFGRGSDYDSRIDSVVRVAAGKLRSRLVEYYASEGSADLVIIELPKGSYAPVIRVATPPKVPRAWPRWGIAAAALGAVVALGVWVGWPAPKVDSLAVLPFLNLQPANEGDHFSDGLTEELIDSLTKLENLKVAARTSAFEFKDARRDIREIGKRLGVEAVIEGSVRRQGDRFRVTVQMNRTADGFHLWSQTYDRTAGDLFAIQEDIAGQVASRLSRKSAAIRTRHRPPFAAYELFLHGRQFIRQRTRKGGEMADANFREAIARDPEYAEAYVALADMYIVAGRTGEARRLLDKALTLDPDLWEAHASMGRLKAEADWDWAGSEASFRRAMQLNPGSVRARYRYGRILARLGRHTDSIRELQAAVRLDPVAEDARFFLTEALFFARRFDESLRESRAMLELFPNSWGAHLNMGLAHAGKGEYREAIREYEQASALDRDNPGYLGALGHAYAAAGDTEQARRLLDRLLQEPDGGFRSPVLVARIYLGLGDRDKVFEYLEKGFQRRDQFMLWLKVDPRMDPIRGDPRYSALLERMKLK